MKTRAWLRKRDKEEREERGGREDINKQSFSDLLLINFPVETVEARPVRASAVAVLVISPVGIPLVRDRRKSIPYWKLPGGRAEPGESATAAAVREVDEEVGATVDLDKLVVLAEEDRGDHDHFAFRVPSNTRRFKEVGDEGEEVGIFQPEKIINMPDLFPPHRQVVMEELRLLCGARPFAEVW